MTFYEHETIILIIIFWCTVFEKNNKNLSSYQNTVSNLSNDMVIEFCTLGKIVEIIMHCVAQSTFDIYSCKGE